VLSWLSFLATVVDVYVMAQGGKVLGARRRVSSLCRVSSSLKKVMCSCLVSIGGLLAVCLSLSVI